MEIVFCVCQYATFGNPWEIRSQLVPFHFCEYQIFSSIFCVPLFKMFLLVVATFTCPFQRPHCWVWCVASGHSGS